MNYIVIGLFTLGLGCFAYVLIVNLMKTNEKKKIGNVNCVKESLRIFANDDLMTEILKKGQPATLLTHFYKCNPVKKNDLVYFRFSEHIDPVIRIVKGVPGDRYQLVEDKSRKGQWTISINGELILDGSSPGQPYLMASNSVPPLKTYELSRGGLLREDEYIVLSTRSPSLSDSTNLGLISKNSFVGKVVPSEE